MYAGLFEVDSWIGKEQHIFEGNSASELLDEFEKVQSLGCLAQTGRMQEKAKGQKELDKLDIILGKHFNGELTNDDLLTLDINLKIGAIKCIAILEGDDAVEKLKAQYPNAK